MKSIIEVEDLSKRYTIGATKSANPTLRDAFGGIIRAPLRIFRRNGIMPTESIWALHHVSAQIKAGETVGIIGKNGAGKSTLLKILSRITEPTYGRVRVWGRMASMLEVGTGFHPELTGRENIFLNGAILGMTRQEIRSRFDEIVEFAEIPKFIDTPVKHYSSGMYLRLAFAVAAHLQPEILIVDEVLAVGDATFQKKCLGKMGVAATQGRTVLFVSHNLQAIRQLCERAIWLQAGEVVADGPAAEVSDKYLQDAPRAVTVADISTVIRQLPPDPAFRLNEIVLAQDGVPVECVLSGKPLQLTVSYEVLERTTGLRVFFDLCDADGALLFRSFHDEDNDGIPTVEPGSYVSRAVIPADILAPMSYELRVHAGIYNTRMCTPPEGIRLSITVQRSGIVNRAYTADSTHGKLALALPWTTGRVK